VGLRDRLRQHTQTGQNMGREEELRQVKRLYNTNYINTVCDEAIKSFKDK
jgi:hypothetical protein